MKIPTFVLALSTASITWKVCFAEYDQFLPQNNQQAGQGKALEKCGGEYYSLYIPAKVPITFVARPDCIGSDCQQCPVFRFPGGKARPIPSQLRGDDSPVDLDTQTSYGPWDLKSLVDIYNEASMDVPEKLESEYIQGDLMNMAAKLNINLADLQTTLKSVKGTGNAPTKGWHEMYIPYNPNNGLGNGDFGDNKPYGVNDPKRQHLHLFNFPSEEPTPVFLFAHKEGSDAAQMPDPAKVLAMGFSVISWETVNGKKFGPPEIQACMDDFELVWQWLQDYGPEHNLDPNKVVVAGESVGSLCSWAPAQQEKEGVMAIYMVDPFPDRFWSGPTRDMITDPISISSPPVSLVYRSDCGDSIENCNPDPDTGHNPKYGKVITSKYTEVGMGSFAKAFNGLTNKEAGIWDLFPRFVATLGGDKDKVAKMKLRASAATDQDGSQ